MFHLTGNLGYGVGSSVRTVSRMLHNIFDNSEAVLERREMLRSTSRFALLAFSASFSTFRFLTPAYNWAQLRWSAANRFGQAILVETGVTHWGRDARLR